MDTVEFAGLSISKILTNQFGLEVGIISLDRPDALNALNASMIAGITTQLARWAKDPCIELVVIKGNGNRAYCAGGDIKALYYANNVDFLVDEYCLDYALYHYPKPIVHLLHGYVMGGGMGLMASGALKLSMNETRFSMPETAIGFFPDVGYRYHLARYPLGLGAWLALTAASFSATFASVLGVVDEVLPKMNRRVFIAKLYERIAGWNKSQGALIDCLRSWAHEIASETQFNEVKNRIKLATKIDDNAHVNEIILHNLVSKDILDWCDLFWNSPNMPWIEDLVELSAQYSDGDADQLKAFKSQKLHELSPLSIAMTNFLLRRAIKQPIDKVFDDDYWAASQLYTHGDLREGVLAKVIARRQPNWRYSFDEVFGGNQVNAEIMSAFAFPEIVPSMIQKKIDWLHDI